MNRRPSPVLAGEDVLRATGGSLLRGSAKTVFQGITTDSRNLTPGNLFIPLVGEKFDGHDFLDHAVRAGASGLLVQKDRVSKLVETSEGIAVIAVADTLHALGDIACSWRRRFSVPVIAVTGSSGKTTTKEMIAEILGIRRRVLKSQGNFNNLVGLPLTLFEMNGSHEAVVLEMGTNRRGEIGRLTEIAVPDVGVITNIGPAHLEGFGSLSAVRDEKGDLFRLMGNRGTAVINSDDEHVGLLAERWSGKKATFGLGEGACVRAERILRKGDEGVRFTLRIGERSGEVALPVIGEHNVRNALAAAAAAWSVGEDFGTIRRGLESFEPISGRMTIRRLKNEAFLIDDSYNANPASMKEALKTLRDLKGKRRGFAVLGDMLELGDQAVELHEEIGRLAADTRVDTLILKGAYSRAVAAGARERGFGKERILFMEEPGEIAAYLASHLEKWDWVLVKGSRKMKLEEVGAAVVSAVGPYEIPGDAGFVIIGD